MGSFKTESESHEPVLVEEVLRLLNLQPGNVVVDATVGSGGHAREILQQIGPTGRLIGIDQDPEALERAHAQLRVYPQAQLVEGNFAELDPILQSLNLKQVDAVILDVGVSREQLEDPRRGFSFLKEGSLDMRMDPARPLTARDLVNDLSQGELEKLFRTYGEERWAKRIAGAICRNRVKKPIETTTELAQLIQETVPRPFRFGARHPATRIFQALRIRVNEELKALEEVLPKAFAALRPRGRLVTISFHSLEDRIVKESFREWAKRGQAEILTRKPVRPGPEEIQRNPRSRSAKLRALEKK